MTSKNNDLGGEIGERKAGSTLVEDFWWSESKQGTELLFGKMLQVWCLGFISVCY